MYTLASGGSDTGSIIAGFAIWIAITISYFTPAIVATIRRVPNAGSVIVIDLLLGWTIIGWIVALAMACRSKPPRPATGYYPPSYYPQQPQYPAPGNGQ